MGKRTATAKPPLQVAQIEALVRTALGQLPLARAYRVERVDERRIVVRDAVGAAAAALVSWDAPGDEALVGVPTRAFDAAVPTSVVSAVAQAVASLVADDLAATLMPLAVAGESG